MARSAAAKAADQALAKWRSLRPKKTKMGTCPVCEYPIYAHQCTAWRSVNGITSRLHDHCKDPS